MTNTTKYTFTAVLISILLILPVRAQNNASPADDVIFKALTDELTRSSNEMVLNNYKPPFYVSYHLYDIKTLLIKATLGTVRQVQENPARSSNIRLMVGDYKLNDENFSGQAPMMMVSNFLPVPLENDYEGIRRAFWISTDRLYKTSLQRYEQKLTALKQQNKADSEQIDDFTKAAPLTYISKEPDFKVDKAKWENVAREVSSVFNTYGDISASTTYIFVVKAWAYTVTSEGAKIKFPVNVTALLVNAYTQAEDGEPLTDHVLYFAPTPDQLPPVERMKMEAKQLADYMVALRNAPALKESYAGPVIFEGDAVAELFSQKLFAPNAGLFATREPVMAVERQGYEQSSATKFDNRIGQKIISPNLSVKAISRTKTFDGIPLVGAFEIDAEGVTPPDELILVQNGILKTLLNGRVPTSKVKESNGHMRLILNQNGYPYSLKSPGVINISYQNGKPATSFRKQVLDEFAQNGLEFIYVIKKLQVPNPGMINVMTNAANRNLSVSKPVMIYQISTRTGEEKLVRSAIINDFHMSAFKQIPGGTSEQMVYNTAVSKYGIIIPSTYIVPQALVFEDLNIEPDRGVTKTKLPVVPNPVLAVK